MGLDKIILEAKHNKSESLISVERVAGGGGGGEAGGSVVYVWDQLGVFTIWDQLLWVWPGLGPASTQSVQASSFLSLCQGELSPQYSPTN